MKTKLSTLMLATLLTVPFAAQASVDLQEVNTAIEFSDYDTKWCRDVSFILRNSLDSAYHANTFESELKILSQGINKTLEMVNPKFAYHFEATLGLALKLEATVTGSKNKTILLRRQIQNALNDLNYIDGRFSNRYSQASGSYVASILSRGLDEALRAKTDDIEMLILDTVASAAQEILFEADYRRSPSYACAANYLKALTEFSDVFYKRSLINQATVALQSNYGCRY